MPRINAKGDSLIFGKKEYSLGKGERFPNYKKKAEQVPGPGY